MVNPLGILMFVIFQKIKIMNKNTTFVFGASFIIGNYILPRFLNNLKENIHNDVSINVSVSHEAIEDLLDKKIDIACFQEFFTAKARDTATNDSILKAMDYKYYFFVNYKKMDKYKMSLRINLVLNFYWEVTYYIP